MSWRVGSIMWKRWHRCPSFKYVDENIFFLGAICNDAASLHCFSLLQSSRSKPCSCPWGTPCHLAYVSVVYFKPCGCAQVPICFQMWDCALKVSVSMSSKRSCYSWPPRPATFSLHRRRLGRCQGYLPVKIGQIMGWPQAPVSLMWPNMLAPKYVQIEQHKNKHRAKQSCRGSWVCTNWHMFSCLR